MRNKSSEQVNYFNHSIFEYLMYSSEFTDASFAEKLGCSRQAVFMWRTGARKPTEENVAKIAEALEIIPTILKMSDDDFVELLPQDDIPQKLRQFQESLEDYLKWLDA